MDKDFKELFGSKCERDYKNRHYWQSIGCIGIRPIFRVWHCTQCDKCITEELKMLRSCKDGKNRTNS